MSRVYACTHVSKLVSDWSDEDGASVEQRCTMDERVNVTAPSFPELLAKLRARYFLALDDLFIPGDGPTVEWIEFNRLEDGDSNEWEDSSEGQAYLADYSFAVEIRTVEPVPLADFTSEPLASENHP